MIFKEYFFRVFIPKLSKFIREHFFDIFFLNDLLLGDFRFSIGTLKILLEINEFQKCNFMNQLFLRKFEK